MPVFGSMGSHLYESSSYQTLFPIFPFRYEQYFFLRRIMNKSQKWHKIARTEENERKREFTLDLFLGVAGFVGVFVFGIMIDSI